MTRKHFRAIASAIAKERRDTFAVANTKRDMRLEAAKLSAIGNIAEAIADELARFNPAFNREKFLAACKGE